MFVDNTEIVVTGRFFKIANLRAEYYDLVENPDSVLRKLRAEEIRADLFTFVQEIHDREPRYKFYQERDSISVLPVATYDQWWKTQISDKTRNMVRKAR